MANPDLGPPSLKMAGLQLWVPGRQVPEAQDADDGSTGHLSSPTSRNCESCSKRPIAEGTSGLTSKLHQTILRRPIICSSTSIRAIFRKSSNSVWPSYGPTRFGAARTPPIRNGQIEPGARRHRGIESGMSRFEVSAPANLRSRRDRIAPKRRRRLPRDDAAKSARAQTVIDVAGGAFCRAELRVCGSRRLEVR